MASASGSAGTQLRVLRRAHGGAAAARNAGVRAALGRIILFTDADCEPVPEWGRVLVAAVEGGADGAKGTYRTRQGGLVARFVQAEYESKYRHMRGRDQIDFVDTYSAAYRRDVLLEAGGFDESVSMVEDQELSSGWRRRESDWCMCPKRWFTINMCLRRRAICAESIASATGRRILGSCTRSGW